MSTTAANGADSLIPRHPVRKDATVPEGAFGDPTAMPLFNAYAATRAQRSQPTLPFGWGAPTALLAGAALLLIGIGMILWGMFGFFAGTIGNATSGNFNIGSFFSGFFGAILLFVVGGVIAGVGGWLVRLWWLFLLVDTMAENRSLQRERQTANPPDVRIRCRTCGGLNPETAKFCMACGKPA